MSFRSSSCASAVVLAILFLPACTQVRGRKRIREANELYHRGKYAEAVTLYKEAEALVPELPVLWLNEGYTCRQLIAPGSHDPESRRAAACALGAFRRLGEVAPKDPRAGELILQTWFDVQDYPSLEATFLERRRRAPDDLDAVHGLQDVYFKWGKWPQALEWSKQAAALRANDAEAQYGVGTFVWQILSTHGGGPQMAGYSPWPDVAGANGSMTVAASGDHPGRHQRRGARRAGRSGDRLPGKGARSSAALSGGHDLPGTAVAAEVLRVLHRSHRLAGRRRRGRQLAAKGGGCARRKVVTGGLRSLSRGVSAALGARAAHRCAVDRLPRRASWRRESPIRSGTSTS